MWSRAADIVQASEEAGLCPATAFGGSFTHSYQENNHNNPVEAQTIFQSPGGDCIVGPGTSCENSFRYSIDAPQENAGMATAHTLRPGNISRAFSQSMPDLTIDQSPPMQPLQHYQQQSWQQPQQHHDQEQLRYHWSQMHSTSGMTSASAGHSGTHRLPAHNPYVGTFPRAPAAAGEKNIGAKRPSPSTSDGANDLTRFMRQVFPLLPAPLSILLSSPLAPHLLHVSVCPFVCMAVS
jgi:hypothetical protein